ncbi:MAG: transposase [Bacteroidota bacterium]
MTDMELMLEKFQRIKLNLDQTTANYEVSRTWRIKENFRDIFGCENLEEVSSLILQWINNAKQSLLKK